MKRKFIPLEKQSKRQRKEYYAAQRKTWGEFNPVTRTVPSAKVYNRKKSGKRYENEPPSGFYVII